MDRRRQNIISSHMAELGRKGAKARAASLSPERRREIGRHAIAVRWAKAKARRKTK